MPASEAMEAKVTNGAPGKDGALRVLRSSTMEARVAELEIRYTHLERQYVELSQVVFEHQKLIERLQKELAAVRGRLLELGDPIANDKPPHY